MIVRLLVCAIVSSMFLSNANGDDVPPSIIVAEGERFVPQNSPGPDAKGWAVKHQDESYATQTFGGMWVSHGGLIAAPADSENAVATQQITVPADGKYRVWSKYQSPPYFQYLHRVEVWQNQRKVYAYDYGKLNAKRMYSFFGKTVYGLEPKSQVWYTWGVDHDAAEAPSTMVSLKKGVAEVRLITLPSPKNGGDRFIDFVLLTTNAESTCEGWQKWGQAKSPFMFEAIHSTPLYFRFQNVAKVPAKAKLDTQFGHFTWHCAPKREVIPQQPVPTGKWSPWIDICHIVELFTDEGLAVSLVNGEITGKQVRQAQSIVSGNVQIPIEVARDPRGRDRIGKLDVPNGESIHFPLDIVWNRKQKLRLSKDIAAEFISESKTNWRKAANHKPRHIAFYGSFSRGDRPWAMELKDALGYNTLLPKGMETLPVDGYHQHLRNEQQIRQFAEKLGTDRKRFRVCSFGDEISLGKINYDDPKYVAPFREWLKARGVTNRDIGMPLDKATLGGNSRLNWYSKLFSAEQRFAHYRNLTSVAKQAFGKQVLTGANYSPHHDVMYYGNQLQWIDAFKHNAMSMFWTEDYLFFVPELPQTISFMFARMHCAVKYNRQPIHMYVMPHQPGQPADYFRRNMLLSIGAGAKHIDNFWVAPQENYSENYISWQYPETFQALFEAMHDTAAVEPWLEGSKRRPARVAIITGKATALNEDLVEVDTQADKFLKMSHLASKPHQNICRKDQQFIYFALKHAQHRVDLITEDDIVELDILKNYDVVYFAGEWIHTAAIPELDQWVRQGGTLCASTGLGIKNQYNEADPGLQKLLGIKARPPVKNLYHVRPLLELPLADPIGKIQLQDQSMSAIAMRQELQVADPTVEVLGTWENGKPAVTVRTHGKGQAIAIGTAAGSTYLKTGVRPLPWARGGRVNLYNPDQFSPGAKSLVRLGTERGNLQPTVTTSEPLVESLVLENRHGTLLTLVNWSNLSRIDSLSVSLPLAKAPKRVFSITMQKPLEFSFEDGKLLFHTQLTDADFVTVE